MPVLIAFAVTLFVAVLISGLAKRSILSTSVLFLFAGLIIGLFFSSGKALPAPATIQRVAEITLFAVLFSDGMRMRGVQHIRRHWRLPGRALLYGMPLTIAGIALIGHYLAHLEWKHAFLFGAALSPTDPVFVSAIFDFEEIPNRLKSLLNLESGLNDGLALPPVLFLIADLSSKHPVFLSITVELVLGAIIGVAVPWAAIRLEETRFFSAVGIFESLFGFSVALLVYATCVLTNANLFIAAFLAGITVISVGKRNREDLGEFNELVAELSKLIALLLLGIVASRRIFAPLAATEYIAILLAVFAVRPVAIFLSLVRTRLPRYEILTVGWFGPKGFASVVYGVMILSVDPHLAHMVGLAVIISILIYSSTDILVGRIYQKRAQRRSELRRAA